MKKLTGIMTLSSRDEGVHEEYDCMKLVENRLLEQKLLVRQELLFTLHNLLRSVAQAGIKM